MSGNSCTEKGGEGRRGGLRSRPAINHWSCVIICCFGHKSHNAYVIREREAERDSLSLVPTGSPSCGGEVAFYVFDINQQSLPAPFYSVFVSVSVFMALSTVFHSINSPDNSPLSHSVLLILFLPYWSFKLYLSL